MEAIQENGVSQDATAQVLRVLEKVGYSMLAIHRMAFSEIDSETLKTSIEVMTRDNFRSLDACIAKLGGQQLGNFSDVFVSEIE